MTALTTTIRTPDGPFTIIERDSVVLASGWTADTADLTGQIHASLKPVSLSAAPTGLRRITDAVEAYYDGDLDAVAAVPVHQLSGPFRVRAWEVLRAVRPGEPVTYAQYAALTGSPTAVRAAAAACARNAAALFVPCHRVVRTDGTLGGFRWGLEVKRRLLDREAQAETDVLVPSGQGRLPLG